MLKASPNRIWGLLWVVSWRSCLGSSWGKSNKGQNMLISPFYHSFIHLNMNTIALNAESRLILTRQMDTKIYLKSNIVYSSFLSPVSFFLSCFGLFCHTKLYIDQSAPGSNQDTDRSSFKLSFCHFLLYISLSQSLSPVFFPFSISPRRIHCLISMAGF